MCFAPKVSAPKVEAPAMAPEPIKDDPAPVSYGTAKDDEKSGTSSLKVEKTPAPKSAPVSPKQGRISSKFGMNKSRK